jgi:NAD+ kinase
MNVATGSRSTSFEGDGIIVSSSIGSTGYAFSAGGPKARPTERNLIVVPICPYRRAFSPCVLSEDETTEVTVGSDCALIIDGVFVRRLKKSEKVTVQKGSDILFFSGVGRWE